MKKKLKLTMLVCGFGIIFSCNVHNESNCSTEDEIFSFTSKIKFEEYHRDGYMYFNIKYDDKGWFIISNDSIPYTEKFLFNKDGSFSYLKIAYQISKNDTVKVLNGKFKTYKDGSFPWHILKLNGDFIYEKQRIEDTLNGNLHFSSDFTATKFLGLSDSLLTDVGNWVLLDGSYLWQVDSNCFNLQSKGYSAFPCNYEYVPNAPFRTFCLKKPEETP